jgi:hypothetical protein
MGGQYGGYGGYGSYGSTGGYRISMPSLANAPVIDAEVLKFAKPVIDKELTQRLADMPSIHTRTPITVGILPDGTAKLQGRVATLHDRELAEMVLLLQPGISTVRNELAVGEPAEETPKKR